MSTFRLTSAADARTALEYFNAFHDGFIRELSLRSHDRFEARGAQQVSGRLDLDITFAHYNYRSGEPPADQLVRARFGGVSAVVADFRLTEGAWFIDRLEITAGETGGLVARLYQQRLVGGAWGPGEELRFAFVSAELEEVG